MKEEMMVLISLIILVFVVKVYMVLWWKPKKIEKHFGKQGIKGPSYCFFIGNAKEIVSLMMKASSQPMAFSHNILPRVLSFYHHWNKIYGPTFLIWFGPMARLTVADPDLIREIFCSKSELYEKNEAHPLIKQLEARQMLLTSEAFQKISIPGYRFLPTKGNRETWKLQKEIKKKLMKLIEKRSKKWDDDEEMVNRPKDLLGLMIEASRKKESLLNSTSAITARDIAEECKSFFFAGEQTTSNLLTWTTVLLAMLRLRGRYGTRGKFLCRLVDDDNMNESLRLFSPKSVASIIVEQKAVVELADTRSTWASELLHFPILAVLMI
ncbi:cytochrome P450 734A1-like protein [Tanacetum coccineum]